MTVTAAPLRPTERLEEDEDDGRTAELRAAVDQQILDLLGWSDEVGMLFFPYDHHLLGMPKCRVKGCSQASVARQLCEGCRLRWRQAGRPAVDEYVETARPGTRRTGVADCSVKGCPRPFRSWRNPVCSTHFAQLTRLQVTLEEFLVRDDVVPLPAFGNCEVVACHRKRDGRSPYCHGHRVRWSWAVKRGLSTHNEARWRRTAAPVSANNEVSLRGLTAQVVAEILYGIQARTREGLHTTQPVLRTLTNRLRELELPSLTAVELDQVSRGERGFCSSLITHVGRFGLTPEGERAKDVWNGAIFGHAGHLHFTGIHQPWLRSAAKEWAFFSLPQRRGKAIATCQEVVSAFALLSESLQLQRDDCGNDIRAVCRRDITAFANRLSHLRQTASSRSAEQWSSAATYAAIGPGCGPWG
ncbi:hypothetical protein [Streptomyces sp. NPDC086777]|uniref:hypothetical protein n=1 Tax=Streptomyces sp. NPDC086777 TaxID=3154866 RepID=UPI00344EF01A